MKKRLLSAALILLLTISIAGIVSVGAPEPNGIVAFISDFGRVDHYVGAMVGAALSKSSEIKVVHISHEIEEFNVRQGAMTSYLAARHFPRGTVFCVAVDPGGASGKSSIALKTESGHYFVAPDNGALTFIMNNLGVSQVRRITNPDWTLGSEKEKQFDYRDILPPAAASLASGEPFEEAGPVCKAYKKLDVKKSRVKGNSVVGEVILIDSYGNIQANVKAPELREIGLEVGDKVTVKIGDVSKKVEYATTYSDVPEGDFLTFRADTDFMEVSINMGSAKEAFGAKPGDEVVFQPVE